MKFRPAGKSLGLTRECCCISTPTRPVPGSACDSIMTMLHTGIATKAKILLALQITVLYASFSAVSGTLVGVFRLGGRCNHAAPAIVCVYVVCMHVSMHVCIHVCMCVCMHVRMSVCLSVFCTTVLTDKPAMLMTKVHAPLLRSDNGWDDANPKASASSAHANSPNALCHPAMNDM